MRNPYIHELIKDENREYNCECLVVDDTKILDGVGFKLKGKKIKELWRNLEDSNRHNYNYEFHFGSSKEIALDFTVRDKRYVHNLVENLGWPKLFLDD